jgi:hypothetical protein
MKTDLRNLHSMNLYKALYCNALTIKNEDFVLRGNDYLHTGQKKLKGAEGEYSCYKLFTSEKKVSVETLLKMGIISVFAKKHTNNQTIPYRGIYEGDPTTVNLPTSDYRMRSGFKNQGLL